MVPLLHGTALRHFDIQLLCALCRICLTESFWVQTLRLQLKRLRVYGFGGLGCRKEAMSAENAQRTNTLCKEIWGYAFGNRIKAPRVSSKFRALQSYLQARANGTEPDASCSRGESRKWQDEGTWH